MLNVNDAVRQLVRHPGISMVIVVMLAVGIGATTAVFSLFHQVLVRPLPVPAPGELVTLREDGPKAGAVICGDGGNCDLQHAFSDPVFRELEERQTVFTGIAAYHGAFQASLVSEQQATSGTGVLVSGSYFDVLRLQPALGRLIGPQDEPRAGESTVAVLSYAYWQSRLGGATDVVGRTLTVNGRALTIIGVAPQGFSGTSVGSRPDVFVPLTLRPLMAPYFPEVEEGPDERFTHFATLFARLAPGRSVERAAATLNAMYTPILEQEISLNPDLSAEQIRQRRLVLEPAARGQSSFRAPAMQPLALLLGLTVLVLLVVCANVANLLLARGASRTSELAIRTTLGATRGRLIAQLLTEVAMLAAIGIVGSLPVASVTLGLIVSILPEQLAGALDPRLSWQPMLYATAGSLATVVLFSVFSASRITRADVAPAMKAHTAQLSAGRGALRARSLLMTAQVALSMVLLVLAGLFAVSLTNIARIDLGMNVDSVVYFRIDPSLSGYEPERRAALHDRLTQALAAQPGVTSVSSARDGLIGGFVDLISMDGFDEMPPEQRMARSNSVSPGFFDVLSMPLLAGRAFTEQDRNSRVAIVNASFVRKFDLGEGGEAIGKRFGSEGFIAGDETVEIVGVVADAKNRSVKEDVEPQFFLPYRAESETLVSWLHFYVRGGIGIDALTSTIPRVLSRAAPSLPISELTSAPRHLKDEVYVDRMVTTLSAGFAGIATLLAAVGLYGLVAFGVTQRTRELGLRLALGAGRLRLRMLVLKQVGVVASIGGAVGVAAAIGLGRAAEALLFGVSGYEPLVLVAAVSVLGIAVLSASYIPARRASNIEPMEALRQE